MLSTPVFPTQINNIHTHSLSLPPSSSLHSTKKSMTQPKSQQQQKLQHQKRASVSASLTSEEHELRIDSNTVKIGSRRSQLAVIQSEIVGATISKYYPKFSTPIVKVSTLGDQVQNKPLYSFGGKALWTKELEILLMEPVGEFDQIDMIVHSLKDMPTVLPDEFELGCILQREDPRDALVMKAGSPYKSLAELPEGSIVGTSSVRRSAQLLKNYPTLKFKSVRGNVNTRLSKLDDPESDYACLILASAGLIRLGLKSRITEFLNKDEMYYAVGQGALGIEIRKNDIKMKKVCEKIGCKTTTLKCIAERALLRALEGGCSVPVGCNTEYNSETQMLTLDSIVLNPEGTEFIELSHSGRVTCNEDAATLGLELANKLIANGAKKILDEINFDKINEIKQAGLTSSN